MTEVEDQSTATGPGGQVASGAHLAALYRYPVKGLSAEPLDQIAVEPGQTIPFDRAWAIENGRGRFDPDAPRHLPKINFLMLMRDERLATLQTRFDEAAQVLTVLRDGKQIARGALCQPLGRSMLEQFFAAYLQTELRGAAKIVAAEGHSFSDVAAKCVHIVNLASLRELERILAKPLDPLRFRANLYLDGLPPWAEFNWLDKSISIGDVKLGVFDRTQRCEATNVEPATGQRNMALPQALQRHLGHSDFGVYARISGAGTLARGAAVSEG